MSGNAEQPPAAVVRLLEAGNPPGRERAWEAFLERYSKLLLHVAHSTSNDHDGAMDRYAYIVERLYEEDFRRIRAYRPDVGGKFTTWMVVVARRMCEDFRRSRYGREPRGNGNRGDDRSRVVRARLVDLIAEELDPETSPAPRSASPELQLRRRELSRHLEQALDDLDSRDRLLFKLRFQDGLPGREIADVMAFPTVFHVYRHINRRLGDLRSALERRGVTDPRP